jgi:hypothetical protein
MSREPERLEEIERYLHGDLTSSEKEAFEEKLRRDAAFAEEVEMHRTAVFLIKAGGIRKMKKQLESYSVYAEPAQKGSSVQLLYRWYAWAAAALMILILSYIYLIPTQASDPEELFTAYFVPPPAERQRLRNESEASEKMDAFRAYEEKRYHQSALLFEKILNDNRDNDLLFYAGVSALADNQPQKAISYFTELLKDQNSLYLRRTQWYLSLAYLKNGQAEKAKEYLSILTLESNSYQGKAKELLEDVK